MKDQDFTHEESLEIIGRMILQAKTNYLKGSSFYLLLWGWVVVIANIGHYLIQKNEWLEKPYYIWIITIPAVIITIVQSVRSAQKRRVTTHLDSMYGHVWMAVGIGIIFSLIFMNHIDYYHNAFILIFAMIGTYISGQMLQFKPLVYGAFALLVSGIVCFNVSLVDQYLVGGVGIFLGYLVPGYLLKSKESE